ncbi:MAG: hypothetical protein GY708_07020 [Actinomycetia bacterium]|nr:hypothetical protein [Actinomycetes bacterium]MCP4959858.1 hypothetical protein [Actinomycetes bacterium]
MRGDNVSISHQPEGGDAPSQIDNLVNAARDNKYMSASSEDAVVSNLKSYRKSK